MRKSIWVLSLLFFFTICFLAPQTSRALDLRQALISEDSIVVKIQEGIEYFFAFNTGSKVRVLEKQADKRLNSAKNYSLTGNNDKVQSLIQNYLQIKTKQDLLLDKSPDGDILDQVENSTIEQQKMMEEIKIQVGGDIKQQVIDVQEQVVNQVAKNVIDIDGKLGQTEFLNKVEHVWAPGTGPGGESGVVVVGGLLQFAPGTSAGGEAEADIHTVEVKTGGVPDEQAPVNNGGSNFAPGTTRGGTEVNTIDPGGMAPGTSSDGKTWIAP